MKFSITLIIVFVSIFFVRCNSIKDNDNNKFTQIDSVSDINKSNSQTDFDIIDNEIASTYNEILTAEDAEQTYLMFKTKFLKALEDQASFNYDFPTTQQKGITLLKSRDNKVKVYSWDTNLGGTMHFFAAAIQVKDSDSTKTTWYEVENAEIDEYIPSYTAIDMIEQDDKTIYLLSYRYIVSNKQVIDGVEAYSIQGGVLKPHPVFKIKSEKAKTHIERTYDIFEEDEFRYYVTYDSTSKSVLEVLTDEFEKPIERMRVYSWHNGFFIEK